MSTGISRYVPAPVRPFVQRVNTVLKIRVYYAFKDNLDVLLGRRDPLIPPARLNFVGQGDYREVGEEMFRLFVDVGGLRPTDSVLDMGCGLGRMAVPLTKYLDARARYEGLDIVKLGVDWARANITPRHPNFNFRLADIYNKSYNPGGRYEASEYRFPYPDGSFDFVFLTSVFTHMLARDVENYVSEISRVMRPGARFFSTYFILNDESLRAVEAGAADIDFRHEVPEGLTSDPDHPENAIAFREPLVRARYERHGLRIVGPIRYGTWAGRPDGLTYQDVILAVKP